jgi:hypothetical protein
LQKSVGQKFSLFLRAGKTPFYQNPTPKVSANACGKNARSSNHIEEMILSSMILSKAATSPRRSRAARRLTALAREGKPLEKIPPLD